MNDVKDVIFLILLLAITNYLRGGKTVKDSRLALSSYLKEISP